ncbi:hypothetical protein [Streptomyces rochei]|uniref:hypothetical protein n=1 Tax=Streptomyces rochei TaxID=1928 RepID=UPI003799D98A
MGHQAAPRAAVEDIAEVAGCVRQQDQRQPGLVSLVENIDDVIVDGRPHVGIGVAEFTQPAGAGVVVEDRGPVREVAEVACVVGGAGGPEGVLEGGEVVLGPQGGAGQAEPLVGGGLQADDAVVRNSSPVS